MCKRTGTSLSNQTRCAVGVGSTPTSVAYVLCTHYFNWSTVITEGSSTSTAPSKTQLGKLSLSSWLSTTSVLYRYSALIALVHCFYQESWNGTFWLMKLLFCSDNCGTGTKISTKDFCFSSDIKDIKLHLKLLFQYHFYVSTAAIFKTILNSARTATRQPEWISLMYSKSTWTTTTTTTTMMTTITTRRQGGSCDCWATEEVRKKKTGVAGV